MYKFIKKISRGNTKKHKLNLNNILSKIMKNPDKPDSLFIRLVKSLLCYFTLSPVLLNASFTEILK